MVAGWAHEWPLCHRGSLWGRYSKKPSPSGKGLCVRHGVSCVDYFFQVISMLLRSEKPFI
jgi:hypothetical protein